MTATYLVINFYYETEAYQRNRLIHIVDVHRALSQHVIDTGE